VASSILNRSTGMPPIQPLGAQRPALNCYRFGTSVQCY